MSKKIKDCKVYVRSIPGAKVHCMDDYKKPSIRDEPDHLTVHRTSRIMNCQKCHQNLLQNR